MMPAFEVTEKNRSLLTDLYQLTMAAAYWANGVTGSATFELYFRRLPARRSFILAAGLEQALEYILHLRFSPEQIEWLQKQRAFHQVAPDFFEYLARFRFTGDVSAVPEGTPIFPLEPVIQIHAPMIEAQILETYLLSMINMQSMIATKAARIVRSAKGKAIIDFGTRRAHGPEAGLLAARASYIGGCVGTSNVLAGYLESVPIFGTAAHSFTMAFESEKKAFEAYHRTFPEDTTLLIDTYNVLEGARNAKQIPNLKAVRIDSGDLLELSRQVRSILDEDGLQTVKIMASGDLNEYKIQDLLARGAAIDMFGVGTEMVTSYDDPAMSGVYKLVQTTIHGKEEGTFKTSPGKVSYPGKKQVYRFVQNELFSQDEIHLVTENPPIAGAPLLLNYVENGALIRKIPPLVEIQNFAQEQMKMLGEPYHRISEVEDYPVLLSPEIQAGIKGSSK